MKKIIYILSICIGLFCADSFAQMNYKLSSGTSNSSFLFGSTSAQKTQLIYLPGDFNGSLSGDISKIYFMYGSTTSPEYTNLVISLGQTTETAFAGTDFFTGLTEVLNEATYTIPAGVAGEWFSIALTTNFTFDATQTLIVEVKWDSNTETGFTTRYGSQSGQKVYASDPTATSGTASSTWQNFGYDIQVANNMFANSVLSPAGLVNTPSVAVQSVFQNGGTAAMSGKYYTLIYDPSMSMVYADSNTFSNVPSGQIDTVSFTDFNTFAGNGTYTVKAIVTSPGDLVAIDDTITTTFNRFLPSYPMVVCWSSQYTNSNNNKDSAFAALDALGYMYDEFDRYTVSISDFTDWSTVFWLEDGSVLENERTSLINFLDAGVIDDEKTLIIFGDDIGYFHGRTASSTYDTLFYRDKLHAEYFADDPQSADQTRICGEAVNPGLCDSLDSSYPDAVGALPDAMVAYRYADLPANSDSVAGVVYDGSTYNVAYLAFEIREIVSPVTDGVNQLISGVFSWVVDANGAVPVEFTSFTADVNGSDVSLNWKTATETNNKGFAVERKAAGSEFEEIAFVQGNGSTTERKSYSFIDSKVNVGFYTYRLKQVDFDGTVEYSNEIEVQVLAPKVFSLEQNFPNPFNPTTKIKYSVPVDGFVNLTVFNTLGQKVSTIVQQQVKAGEYEVEINGSGFASGVYFYRLEAGKFVSIKKMVLLK